VLLLVIVTQKYYVDAHLPLRLRNDLYCVEWGVKLYSLTHAHLPFYVLYTVSQKMSLL